MIACSTEKLLFFVLITHQSYSEPLKKTSPPPSLHGRGPSWLGGGGGGVWIFSGTTHLRFDKVVVSQSKQKHFDIENIHRLNEIPGRKFRAKTWYLHMWKQHIIFSREISPLLWVHDKSRLSQQKLLKWNSLVFCSLRSLVKYFSTLEDKFLTYARPCNILYI